MCILEHILILILVRLSLLTWNVGFLMGIEQFTLLRQDKPVERFDLMKKVFG